MLNTFVRKYLNELKQTLQKTNAFIDNKKIPNCNVKVRKLTLIQSLLMNIVSDTEKQDAVRD